jgi:hypothetical protein
MHSIPIIYFPNFEHYEAEYSKICILSDLPLLGDKTVFCGGFFIKNPCFFLKVDV